MRGSLRGLALMAVAACMVGLGGGNAAAAAAGTAPGAAAPTLSFRHDPKSPGWYIVTTRPASRLKVTLISFAICDFTGQNCAEPEEIDSRFQPKATTHRVAWNVAAFWDQPAGDDQGGFYPGTYRIVFAIPGTKVSTST